MTFVFTFVVLGLIAGAFWLGNVLGYDKATKEADKAFRELVEHAESVRNDIERLPTRDLRERVRAARRGNGSV